MQSDEPSESERERQLDAIIAEYYCSVEKGEAPDQGHFIARYPDYQQELSEFFADLDMFQHSARSDSEDPVLEPTTIDSTLQRRIRAAGDVLRYFGAYEILEELGSGGMGVVYKARHLRLRKLVALKMIRAGEFATDFEVKLFHSEARAAAKLDHPGIVAVHEVGMHAGQHFYSMDYVVGGSLSKLHRDEPVAARRAADLVRQMAEAIHYAHEKGIVHRDLKPANILLTAHGEPRITDFGLAKRFRTDGESHATTITESGQILGTAGYMPPEQAAGKSRQVGPLSDVYSLGAVLYALLTSRAPFIGETPSQIIMQVLHTEPVSPRILNPSVPRDLETICLKCLEKDAHKRYGTAQLLAEDLARFLDGRPVVARPISWPSRGWRWCRRNPWAATALALLVTFSLVSPPVAYHEFQQTMKIRHLLNSETDLRGRAQEDAKQIKTLLMTTEKALEEATSAEQAATQARGAVEKREQEAKEATLRERRRRFVSDMNLIAFNWELGNLPEMQRLLDEQTPRDEEEDLREFTWRHWSHVVKSQHGTPPVKPPAPGFLKTAVSKDGSRVAYASYFEDAQEGRGTVIEGRIHVRRSEAVPDAPDEFRLPIPGKFPWITDIAFVENSSTLAVGDVHQVTLWDLSRQPPLATKVFGGAGKFEGLPDGGTFSSNGRYFVRLDKSDKIYRVWDLVKRTSTIGMPQVDGELVRSVHVNDEGTRLVTSSGRVWNVLEQREEFSLPLGMNGLDTRFAPNGDDVIAQDSQLRLSLWNRNGQERLLSEIAGNPCAISATRNEVSWTTPRGVHVRSLAEPGLERVIRCRGIYALRFLPGDKELMGLSQTLLHRWPLDLADPTAPKLLEDWNNQGVGPLSVFGTYYAVCKGTEASLWETASGKLVKRFNAIGEQTGIPLLDANRDVRSYAVNENGLLITCGSQGTAAVWNGFTGELVDTLRQSGSPATDEQAIHQMLYHVAASEDGNVVVATRGDGSITIWNRESKSERRLVANTHFTTPPVLTPDGRLLRTVGRNGGITVWDVATLQPVPARTKLPTIYLGDRWISSELDIDGATWLCDAQTGERFQRLGVHPGLNTISATPDGKNIATLSHDGSLIVWDARQSTPLLSVDLADGKEGKFVKSHKLAFLEHGKTLAVILADGSVRYWRTIP